MLIYLSLQGGTLELDRGHMGLDTSVLQGSNAVFHVSVAFNGQLLVRGIPSDSFTQEDLDAGHCAFAHDSEPSSEDAGFVFTILFQHMTSRPATFVLDVRDSSFLVSLIDERPSVPPVSGPCMTACTSQKNLRITGCG